MDIIYSEERGTWNLFLDNGEWYAEGTLEFIESVRNNMLFGSDDEYEYTSKEDTNYEIY